MKINLNTKYALSLKKTFSNLYSKTLFPNNFDKQALKKRFAYYLDRYQRPFALKTYNTIAQLPFLEAYQSSVKDKHILFTSSKKSDICATCTQTKTLKSQETLCEKCIKQILENLKPIRIGPWFYDTILVEAEWQSFYKWNRFNDYLPSLKDAVIADLGCSNGYFLYRLLHYKSNEKARFIMGFDPLERYHWQFIWHQKLAFSSTLHQEPLGLEQLPLFPKFFNLILCLGVLYHRKDPLHSLSCIHQALAKNGLVILETLIFPGQENLVFFSTKDLYAVWKHLLHPHVTSTYFMVEED